MRVIAFMLVAANNLWELWEAVQWTLSTKLTVSKRQSLISVCAQPSLDSDMPTKQNLFNAAFRKTTMSLQSMFVT